jgi:Zn-dependent M28 family amino/carboxypeptidase
VNGDSIYNGADDDASGTAGVLELAEALSMPGARPKRSVVFLTVSGEEHGLWGSSWFSEHPAVPMSRWWRT